MTRSATPSRKKSGTERTRASKAGPSPLSRDAIVATAIQLADREGLEAVSLRNVAGALDARAMRLYTHIESKEALLELMIDAVYGELEHPPAGDWREALRVLAQSLRAAAARHPWFIGLLGGRPNLGVHAFAHLEACLAALDFADIDDALEALRIVRSYAIGAIQGEASELASGQDVADWQKATWAHVQQMLATGRYPMVERVVREATHPEDTFERGLERVLAGIGAGLQERR